MNHVIILSNSVHRDSLEYDDVNMSFYDYIIFELILI